MGAHLDHVDGFLVAGLHHLDVAVLQLGGGGIDHQLPLHAPDPHRSGGPLERDAGQPQRRRGTHHREDVGIVLLIGGQDHGLDEHFILVAFGEQRTDRSIDHPHGQDFLVSGAPFPLEEPPGELAGREALLPVIRRERDTIPTMLPSLTKNGTHRSLPPSCRRCRIPNNRQAVHPCRVR